MTSPDAAALVAAAVRAAVLAKAPRRTVAAVAAAVTGVLVKPQQATPHKNDAATASGQRADAQAATGASAEDLVAALREARSAQRRRKKERRKERKQALALALPAAAEEPSAPKRRKVSAPTVLAGTRGGADESSEDEEEKLWRKQMDGDERSRFLLSEIQILRNVAVKGVTVAEELREWYGVDASSTDDTVDDMVGFIEFLDRDSPLRPCVIGLLKEMSGATGPNE